MPKCGYLSPSSFSDLMSNGRGKDALGKMAMNVIDSLVMDMLGVVRTQQRIPPACQWGIDHEWEAIKEYEERTFRMVQATEFTASKTHSYVGGTMDGLVGKIGGIEVKSPFNSTEHLYNITEARQAKTIYQYQIQGYFWVYGLEWIDFVSYDPRFPYPHNLALHRQFPDQNIIQQLQERCELAYTLAREKIAKLR